jgi:CRISPR-associated endonuclease/helicase Cas3
MVVYAKSKPVEDLKTHTRNLLKGLYILREEYGDSIGKCLDSSMFEFFWDALDMVARYHDVGKLHTPFQNRIRKLLGESPIPTKVKEIPHNLLAPAFIKHSVQAFPKGLHRAIYQAIAYHHDKERETEIIINPHRWDEIKSVIKTDLEPNLYKLSDMEDIVSLPTKLDWAYRKKIINRIKPNDGDIYKFYVLVKGLLHRLDHAASAHLNIEEKHFGDSQNYVFSCLQTQGISKKHIWQKIAAKYREKNIVLIASTGIGKTEFAYLWLGKNKGFYTLPVRTSVNAMYERTRETFQTDRIGLLHNDNCFYQAEKTLERVIGTDNSNSEGLTQSLRLIDVSRQLAMPYTISTADQFFTSVLKYKGYEKIYSTLSYSKVVIDEVQSYDPEIVAIILKGLEETTKLGGKFCLMTATLPSFYQNFLSQISDTIFLPKMILPDRKHRIKIENDDIIEHIEDIVNAFKTNNKVLVIVNTVKKAQTLFNLLKQYLEKRNKNIPINLLHSAFTYEDRRRKEEMIFNSQNNGIWITTQLVEVSLNIDFPVLFTEMATIDALIQRMGRILRFSKGTIDNPFIYNKETPNIYIFTEASGMRTIYDEDIKNRSLRTLLKYNNKLLSEEDKQSIIYEIFQRENLEGTNYLKKFDLSMKLLENGLEADNKTDAQALFRRISNVTVIPIEIKEKHNKEIESALNLLEKKNIRKDEYILALYTLRKYSLSIPIYRIEKKLPLLRKDLFMTTMEYNSSLGLIPDKESENIF